MPAIMALEGPRGTSPLARRLMGRDIVPLGGVTDTIKAHPLALVVGILAGAYFFTRGWTPGSIWGGHRAAQSREKAFHGRKRRNR